MDRFFRSAAFFLAACAALAPAPAPAAGFYIQEASVKGLGTAFAGSVTSLDDASTVYFNPAGMTALEGAQAHIGVHLLLPSASLDDAGTTFDFNGPAPGGIAPLGGNDGGNPYTPVPVPSLFLAAPLTDSLWAGIGVSAPFGLANEYDANWFGRYDTTETSLVTVNIQPSLAYEITPGLSVGAGIDIQYADAELKNAVSNVVSEGESILKGDDWTAGYNVGLTFTPRPGTEIGAHYRSAISHDLEGRIIVRGLSAGNMDTGGRAALDLPDIVTLGIAQELSPRWKVMAQAARFGWSNFEDITAITDAGAVAASLPQNYKDTWSFSAGAEYAASEDWTLRAGVQFDDTPVRDGFRSFRTPDGDRTWVAAGATYDVNERFSIDLAGAYIDVEKEDISLSRNSGLAAIRAQSEGSVGIVSVGLNWRF